MNQPRYTPAYQRLTIDQLSDEGCVNVLEAFVKSLGSDYRQARAMYRANPRDKRGREHYQRLKELLLSKYFHDLTNLDGAEIVAALETDPARPVSRTA